MYMYFSDGIIGKLSSSNSLILPSALIFQKSTALATHAFESENLLSGKTIQVCFQNVLLTCNQGVIELLLLAVTKASG